MNIEELKAKALDFIRCGIAANYSGDRRGELMLQVYDPAAAIFEELEAVKAERDALKDELGGWESTLRSLVADKYNENETALDAVGNYVSDLNHDLDSLRARIEAAKKQEPFACYVGEGFIKYPAMNIASIKKAAEKFGYEFAELYTLPPVPAQECTFHGFDAQACMERSKEAPCEPVNHNSIPDFLLEMSRQMRHQDSRSTSHPFWQVRCHRYIPTEQGYNDHHWEICGDEGVIYRSTEEIELLQDYLIENHSEFLNARNEYHDAVDIGEWLRDDINEDDLPDGLRMIYVQQVEEVVSTHFTEHDARGFIERQQHNCPKLYTYVESAYWSPQIRKLQDWIISLTAERQNG